MAHQGAASQHRLTTPLQLQTLATPHPATFKPDVANGHLENTQTQAELLPQIFGYSEWSLPYQLSHLAVNQSDPGAADQTLPQLALAV